MFRLCLIWYWCCSKLWCCDAYDVNDAYDVYDAVMLWCLWCCDAYGAYDAVMLMMYMMLWCCDAVMLMMLMMYVMLWCCDAYDAYDIVMQLLLHLRLAWYSCFVWPQALLLRVGQDRIYTLYMTVCLVISLPKTLYTHHIYLWFWPTLGIIIRRCKNTPFQQKCMHALSVKRTTAFDAHTVISQWCMSCPGT